MHFITGTDRHTRQPTYWQSITDTLCSVWCKTVITIQWPVYVVTVLNDIDTLAMTLCFIPTCCRVADIIKHNKKQLQIRTVTTIEQWVITIIKKNSSYTREVIGNYWEQNLEIIQIVWFVRLDEGEMWKNLAGNDRSVAGRCYRPLGEFQTPTVPVTVWYSRSFSASDSW